GRPAEGFQEISGGKEAPRDLPIRVPVVQRITQKVTESRLAFFLGAYAHLGAMPDAETFFERLSQNFDFDRSGLERAEVAEHVADRAGRRELWAEAKQAVSTKGVAPSLV